MTDEFNLSVLENVTNFASPLKSSANYTALFSLVKEEFDISTEDEMEPQKPEPSSDSYLNRKRLKSWNDKGILKLSDKRRFVKSKNLECNQKSVHFTPPKKSNEAKGGPKKNRSLGSAKPLRSYGMNSKKGSPVCEDSKPVFNDGVDTNSIVEHSSLENSLPNNESHEQVQAEKIPELIPNNYHESDLSQTPVVPSVVVEDVQTQSQESDHEFVESSQTPMNSDLRKRLNSCQSSLKNGSTPTSSSKNSLSEKSEDDQNFSLAVSPGTESRSSNRERSDTPPVRRTRSTSFPNSPNRRIQTPKKMTPKSKTKQSESETPSPLKGLTQELESCISNPEYEQLTDEILQTEFERPSFTFETIELLNDYTHSHQTTSNQILSKIFASPDGETIKEEPVDSLETVNNENEPAEDPLRIDETEMNPQAESATNPNPTLKKKEATKSKKSNQSLKRKSLTSNVTENIDSSSSKRERNSRAKSEGSKPNTDTCLIEQNKRSVEKQKTDSEPPNGSENAETIDKRERRRSSRFKSSEFDDSEILGPEDLPDLASIAMEISEKVDAALKKESVSEEILQQLEEMKIKLRHEVPPQHTIESRAGSKALTYIEQKEFLQWARLNKEPYSQEEDDVLETNWKNFCEDHDWDPAVYKPFLLFKHGNRMLLSSLKERRKFVQFLANGLPNRPLCSVYHRFRTLYGKPDFTGTRYTNEEDMQILAYMLYKPAGNPDKKCSELSKVLHRSRESIWKRFQKLSEKYCHESEKDMFMKVEWNVDLIEKFITTLIDVTLSEDIYELKDAFIPKVVWKKMEEKMNIDNLILKRFWDLQLHMQLFALEPIYLNQIKITLIEYMYKNEFHHPSEIKWHNIVKDFNGYTKHFLRSIFNRLSVNVGSKLNTRNLKKIVKWLYKKKIDVLMNETNDKWLPRIVYKDKKVQICQQDIEINRIIE